MKARDLIQRWDERDLRYAADPRAAVRANEMADGIRINRYAEANALPESERQRALTALSLWRPPQGDTR